MKRFAAAVVCALALAAAAYAHPKTAPADQRAQVPLHIMTWAFDNNNSEGENATAAQVRRYLTYAMGGLGNDKARNDCAGSGSCHSVFYFNAGHVYDSTACPYAAAKPLLAAASEDWFIHLPGYTDKAHRISGTYVQTCKGQKVTIPVYELNQSNPAVARFYAQYLQRNADAWDYYEMDDTSSVMVAQFYGPGGGFCKGNGTLNGYCNKTQEIPNDASLIASHTSFIHALKHRDGRPIEVFYNGVSFTPNGPRVVLLHDPQFKGVICENCIVSAGTFRTAMYAKVLDAMAQANAIPNAQFVELNTGRAPAGSDDQISQRLVTTAVAWLGFSDGRTVVWPNLEFNTHNLAAWPENDLYPTGALQTMSSGASDLQVAPAVWRREFATCYRAGASIGPCGVVLNGTSSPITVSPSWFRSQFRHTVQLHGGDALSGGTIDLGGPGGNVVVPAGRAVLLVQ